VVENLFEFLRTRAATSGRRFDAMRLPDTVLFRHGTVARWYFTSKSGEVLRRDRAKLHRAEVLAHFCRLQKTSGRRSEVLAYYVHQPDEHNGQGVLSSAPRGGATGRPRASGEAAPGAGQGGGEAGRPRSAMRVEYFDREQLVAFLAPGAGMSRTGLLQAFVEPAAGQAAVSTIMATWTPNKTLLERRVGAHPLAPPPL
jgi:hypothetical protein